MDNITNEIFRDKIPNVNKLKQYGFKFLKDHYFFETYILQNEFKLQVSIAVSPFTIKTKVIENATQEPYTLFLVESATGSFVGAVRNSYHNALLDIANNCFDLEIFKTEKAKKAIEYIKAQYDDQLEFLWQKFPNYAAVRRKDNKKWYAVFLIITENKLGINSNNSIEILDLRMTTENIEKQVDNKNCFFGYHMNKKHWITICLNGDVPNKTIFKLIDESYNLAK